MRVITSIEENSARECRTDIAQLPTTWERPALRHKPSQAIAISRIGLRGLEQETEVESAYSAWKADILPLNYSCAKARQEKKTGLFFSLSQPFITISAKNLLARRSNHYRRFLAQSSLCHGLSLYSRTIHPTLPAMYDDFTSH